MLFLGDSTSRDRAYDGPDTPDLLHPCWVGPTLNLCLEGIVPQPFRVRTRHLPLIFCLSSLQFLCFFFFFLGTEWGGDGIFLSLSLLFFSSPRPPSAVRDFIWSPKDLPPVNECKTPYWGMKGYVVKNWASIRPSNCPTSQETVNVDFYRRGRWDLFYLYCIYGVYQLPVEPPDTFLDFMLLWTIVGNTKREQLNWTMISSLPLVSQ